MLQQLNIIYRSKKYQSFAPFVMAKLIVHMFCSNFTCLKFLLPTIFSLAQAIDGSLSNSFIYTIHLQITCSMQPHFAYYIVNSSITWWILRNKGRSFVNPQSRGTCTSSDYFSHLWRFLIYLSCIFEMDHFLPHIP